MPEIAPSPKLVWGQPPPLKRRLLRRGRSAKPSKDALGKTMRLALVYVKENPGCQMIDCARSIYGRWYPGGWKRTRPEFRSIYRLIQAGMLVKDESPCLTANGRPAQGLYTAEQWPMIQAERKRKAELAEQFPETAKRNADALRAGLMAARAIVAFLRESSTAS